MPKKEDYRLCTDEIHMLFECFKESGFTDDQAFELTSTYVRNTVFDNVLTERLKNVKRSNYGL